MTENSLGKLNLPQDIYRVSKEHLQYILTKFRIKYREEDTVAILRPIVADLKAFLKNNWTEQKKYVLRKLLDNRSLSEVELNKYPQLNRIHQFISERDNLYDTPEADSLSDDYEDIDFSAADNLSEKALSSSPQHNTRHTLNMQRENLPLISAGTYHGLPSENPNDFIDKYDIAAQANHWEDATKINLFPAHLASTALAWYKHYTKTYRPDDWKTLKDTFITTFTPAAQATTLQSILEKKVQGRTQPVLAYYLEILTLCRRHDPDMSDRRIAQYVIQGLTPEICERIISEPCETLEELEKSLKKVELQLEIRTANREKYNRVDKNGFNWDSTDNSRQEINNLQAEVKQLSQIISNMNFQQTPTRFTGQQDNLRGQHQNYRGRGATSNRLQGFRPGPRNQAQPMQWRPRTTTHEGGVHNNNYRASWKPRHYGHTQQPTNNHRLPNDMYCRICKRNNHYTQDCRYRSTQTPLNTNTGKYCDYCRMSNHSKQECFKLRKELNKQKNE